jgi:hypothetical protein
MHLVVQNFVYFFKNFHSAYLALEFDFNESDVLSRNLAFNILSMFASLAFSRSARASAAHCNGCACTSTASVFF